jgi:hypothetical protein
VYDHNLELEADFFAAMFLCPYPLWEVFEIKTPEDVRAFFGLSKEASQNQVSQYREWRNTRFKTAWDNDIKRQVLLGY